MSAVITNDPAFPFARVIERRPRVGDFVIADQSREVYRVDAVNRSSYVVTALDGSTTVLRSDAVKTLSAPDAARASFALAQVARYCVHCDGELIEDEGIWYHARIEDFSHIARPKTGEALE